MLTKKTVCRQRFAGCEPERFCKIITKTEYRFPIFHDLLLALEDCWKLRD